MTTTTERLGELVTAVHEGIEFYEYAANRIGLVSLRVVFHGMVDVRRDLVQALGIGMVDQNLRTLGADSLPAATRLIYQQVREEICRAEARRVLALLIQHETVVLGVLQDSCEMIRADGPSRLAEILRVHLQRMRVCLEELERLQRNGFA